MDLKQDQSIHSHPPQNLKRRQPKLLLALGILATLAIWKYPEFRKAYDQFRQRQTKKVLANRRLK